MEISNSFIAAHPLRTPKPYTIAWVFLLLILDITTFIASSCAAIVVAEHYWNPTLPLPHIQTTTTITILAWLLLFSRVGLYRQSFALSTRDELYYTITALCLGATPLLALFTLVPAISSSRIVVILSSLFAIVLTGGARVATNRLREACDHRFPKRIAVIGNAERVAAAAQALHLTAAQETLMVEVEDLDATLAPANLVPGMGIEEVSWFRNARAWRCERMILTEMPQPDILPYLLEAAARSDIELAIAPPRIRAQAYEITLQTSGRQILIVPQRLRACRPFSRLLKRLLDLTLALTAVVLLSPVMLACALAVFWDSGKPIFYRQERVGRDGKTFSICKFRSMRANAESGSGPVWSIVGDARTTRVGAFLRRTSLDELPQLFNVLRGEMSMVGPRPERPFFVQGFREKYARYDERHLVRPGITGWAQIHLDRTDDPSKIGAKLGYDLFYIENWGLFMDVSIIFKTAAEVMFHRSS